MIAFSCTHCGVKLQVKPEFAGRASKCPTCKQPLTVPLPSATVAYVPPQQIDGAESSLAKAGIDGGVTLDRDPAGRKPTALPGQKPQRSVGEVLAGRKKASDRYEIQGQIGHGGMGTVVLAVDCDLRREVAVKYMLDEKDPKKKARFIEEAQINAQLEHPNIVPVYDLGIDAQKRPYLMMKLVKGQSLKDVLDQLRDNPKQAEKEYTLGRLLNILVNVCNALAFAHARCVVHRDLKPANIMLGDFGEVYVMDWGLAKVLKGDAPATAAQPVAQPSQSVAPKRSSKVEISREPEADLTQEGSVLGTPVYMPPEQASGQPVDQRSDVYALGAILYEMLTLQAPIDKEGGYMAIMMRVVQGEIVPPEQREPKRAKAGKIPRELSAIAMKALAKEPGQRYPNVEALRQDIERFQEGRSVSAKEDTKREMIWKFVRRNKGLSAGMVMTLLVLGASLWFVGVAWWKAEQSHAQYRGEQEKRQEQLRESVPIIVEAAKLSVQHRLFDSAMKQVDLALTYAPDHADARLLRAQLLVARKDLAGAERELERYLKFKTNDADTRKLLELCKRGQSGGEPNWGEFIPILVRQKATVLSEQLAESNKELLDLYTRRLREVWPNPKQFDLKIEQDGRLRLTLAGKPIRDVSLLQGMALSHLVLDNTAVADLSPLQGMPLTSLSLLGCGQVRDLSPLKGMPLSRLNLSGCGEVRDLSPLKGMPLSWLNLSACLQVRDFSQLQRMPLTTLVLSGCTQLSDLTVLKGMGLTSLDLDYCRGVTDLTPLKGMSLTTLFLKQSQISDLTPLKEMPLTSLSIFECNRISDLTPLEKLPLREITIFSVSASPEPLRKINTLRLINKVPADEFWKKRDTGKFNK